MLQLEAPAIEQTVGLGAPGLDHLADSGITVVTDMDGRVMSASAGFHALAELMEWPEDHVVLDGMEDARDKLKRGAPVARSTATGSFRFHADIVTLDVEHVLMRDGDGNPSAIVNRFVIPAEVDSVNQGAQLDEARRRLADIARLTSDWLWETDRGMRFNYVSDRVWDVLGVLPAQLIGRPLDSLGRFDGGASVLKPQYDAERRRPFSDIGLAVLHGNGRVSRLRLSGVPVFDPGTGAFRGYRGIARDVTAVADAKAEADLSMSRLMAAVNASNDGFAVFNTTGGLVEANRNFARDFGLSETPAKGEQLAALVEHAVSTGWFCSESEAEARLLRGTLMPADGTLPPQEVELDDGRWLMMTQTKSETGDLLVVCTDITPLKEREQAIYNAKLAAEGADRAKTAFLSTISHELRTPLNAVIGFAEMMRDEIMGPIENAQYRSYVRDILDSGVHLRTLIDTCLDIVKLHSDAVDLSDGTVALATMVDAVFDDEAGRARVTGVTLTNRLPRDLPLLSADSARMRRVFDNLIDNAIKFANAPGKVEVDGALLGDGSLQVIIADDGIGMAPADIPRALDPFLQLDSRLQRRFQGLGMGLPLAKGIVERHGGTFEIDSAPDQGTRIEMTFPASRILATGAQSGVG